MITLEDFSKAVEYKFTGGSEYGWDCFGENARYLDADKEGEYSINTIFDSITHVVYEMQVWDYINNREYRWLNPDFKRYYEAEANKRNIDPEESLDGQKYIDLDVADDILEKANALVNGLDYDSRVKVPVDFTDEELLKYMKMAHERDMTFNQFVEEALRHAIDEFKAGRLTKEDAQRYIRERDENHSSV